MPNLNINLRIFMQALQGFIYVTMAYMYINDTEYHLDLITAISNILLKLIYQSVVYGFKNFYVQ